jgi:hypothetical protein
MTICKINQVYLENPAIPLLVGATTNDIHLGIYCISLPGIAVLALSALHTLCALTMTIKP